MMESGPAQREKTVNFEKDLEPRVLAARLYVGARTQVELEKQKFKLKLESRIAAGMVGDLQNALLIKSHGKEDVFADPLNKMRLDQTWAESAAREEAAKQQLDELKVVAKITAEHQSAVMEAMLAKGISGTEIAAIQDKAIEDERLKYLQEYRVAYQNHMVDRVNCDLTVGPRVALREAGRVSNQSLFKVQDMIEMGKQIFGENRLGKLGKIENQVLEGMQKGILDKVANMAVEEKAYYEILDKIKGTEMYNQINSKLWQVHTNRLNLEQVLGMEFHVKPSDIAQIKKTALNPEEAKQMIAQQTEAKAQHQPERWDKRVVSWAKKWVRNLSSQPQMQTAEVTVASY